MNILNRFSILSEKPNTIKNKDKDSKKNTYLKKKKKKECDKKYLKNSDANKTNDMIDTDQQKNSTWHTKNTGLLKKLGSNNYSEPESNQSVEYSELKYKKNWIKKKIFNKFQASETNNSTNTSNNNQKEQVVAKNRILCFNMLNSEDCSYSYKCLYAHSLDEQMINKNRKEALDLLKVKDLTGTDLIKNKDLRENLTTLTKLCNDCINKACPGGYNCKYGACNKDVLICNTDFQKGDCKNFIEDKKCINGYHLTLRNLVPLVKQKLLHDFPNEHFLKEKKDSDTKSEDLLKKWTQIKKKKRNKVISGCRSLKSIINFDENKSKKNMYSSKLLYESDISSDEELQDLDDIESDEVQHLEEIDDLDIEEGNDILKKII